MCRISDIGGEDGIIAATLFRKIGETHDDENVVVQVCIYVYLFLFFLNTFFFSNVYL